MKLFSIHSGPSYFSAFWVYRIQLPLFLIACFLFFTGYTFSQIRSHPEREAKPLRHSFEAAAPASYYHDCYPMFKGVSWGLGIFGKRRHYTGFSFGYSYLLKHNNFISLRASYQKQVRSYQGIDPFPKGKISDRMDRNIHFSLGKLFQVYKQFNVAAFGGIQYRSGGEGLIAEILRGGSHWLIDNMDYNEFGVHIGVRPQIEIYRRLAFFTDLQLSAYPYTHHAGYEIAGVLRKPNQLTTTFKMGLAFRPF